MEKCVRQHFSSLREWVEGGSHGQQDSRPWLGVPPFIRADDRTVPVSVLSGSNPSPSPEGLLGSEGAGVLALQQPEGSGELAPAWALAAHPKEKPVEKVVLIHPHCPEGHLYGKGKEPAGRGPAGKPCFLPAHRSSGHLGPLSRRQEGETAGK